MATKDKLTDLYNRRSFESRLAQDIKQYQEFQTELSVIIFDVDHFKHVNDTYGHQAGDNVLTSLAQVSKDTMRSSDIIARYGGEEFIILLPNTGRNGSLIIAEELRKAVQDMSFDSSTYNIKITISLGIASICDVKNASLDKLIKHADDALYDAKHNGRNQVCYMKIPSPAPIQEQTNVSLTSTPLLDS
jgi:diguanylate cyclase (GGDEF)-like protein